MRPEDVAPLSEATLFHGYQSSEWHRSIFMVVANLILVIVLAMGEDAGAGQAQPPTYGEPAQQQYQQYPQQMYPAAPPRQTMGIGKLVSKPLVAIGFLVGFILIWLSAVIVLFANGDESVRDFASFLQISGYVIIPLVALVGGLASQNFDKYERLGLLIVAGLMTWAFL